MILLIDNYDFFTQDLYQYFYELGADVLVRRNNELMLAQIDALNPRKVVISSEPCTSGNASVSLDVVRHFTGKPPLLGVCLGHQAMVQAFSANVIQAAKVIHDKASSITHNGQGVLQGPADPLAMMCYHSLVIAPETPPECFEVTARNGTQEIMDIRHREWGTEGVQLHPESILSEQGHQLLASFLNH